MRNKRALIAFAIAAALLSYRTPSFAGAAFGFMNAAINFRDVANMIYQQGTDVCGAECEPGFFSALSSLGATFNGIDRCVQQYMFCVQACGHG